MSPQRSRTGEDLPATFIERRARHARWYGFAFGWTHGDVDDESLTAVWSTSGTVPLHVREGQWSRTFGSGLLLGGTTSDAISLDDAPALRGAVKRLDAWRVGDDGEQIRIESTDVTDTSQVIVWQVKVRGPTRHWDADQGADVSLTAGPYSILHRHGANIEVSQPEEPASAPGPQMEALARGMTHVPAAVSVPRPEVPELTGSSLEDAKRLFALTAAQLADLFGVTERQMRRYLADGELPSSRQRIADALAAIGLTVVGGLGPGGAQNWLYSGAPPGDQLIRSGRIGELAERANALRDSPFT